MIAWLHRFVAVTLMAGAMLGLYLSINLRLIGLGQQAPTILAMPSWVPFWPGFVFLYHGLMVMGWLLPVSIRDMDRFRACLHAGVCGFLLVAPWWVLTPTTLPRPPMPEGWWAIPYQWLVAIDPPNNVFPCAHPILPVAAAWFAGRDRPAWRRPLAGLLVLGLPSIALTWQHRPFDVVVGLIAAAIGIAASETLARRRKQVLGRVWCASSDAKDGVVCDRGRAL